MEANKITEAKEAIRKKFASEGLDEDQIQIRLNQLDCEFLTHAYVNGKFKDNSSQEERLKFYYDFLKNQ